MADEPKQGKPTPTQEENDRARRGEDVAQKEDDGSGPDLNVTAAQRKKELEAEAKPAPASYATRQTKPETK